MSPETKPLAAYVEAWGLELPERMLGRGNAAKYSPPGAIHQLIKLAHPRLGRALPEPVLDPPWRDTAYSVPANAWSRKLTEDERGAGWVRAFDRSGSYLSAWSSAELPYGAWVEEGPRHVARSLREKLPPGYYLVEAAADSWWWWLPRLTYRHQDQRGGGPRWITAPMATQLAHRGIGVHVLHSWTTVESTRALDATAALLSRARVGLRDNPAALAELKFGYAGAVAWWEHGPKSGPMARPAWRRTVMDRFVVNTWRSLMATWPYPFAMTDVDTALFALPAADTRPRNLRVGPELGAWRPKGEAVKMRDVTRAWKDGGAHAALKLMEVAA